MTRILCRAAVLLACSAVVQFVLPTSAAAQTPLLEVEKADATKLMQVNDDGGLVARGEVNEGRIPAVGPGVRLMWYPRKMAFRVGNAGGVAWDDANIGGGSVAMGQNTKASGGTSTALGASTTASGVNSTALGDRTIAAGGNSTAMGELTNAGGTSSTATGRETNATAFASTAMGYLTTAGGDASTAMGELTKATGQRASAMGFRTTASGHASLATGQSTTASGQIATAMGTLSTASGHASTALGFGTIASGTFATALGNSTEARGDHSTAMGSNARALGHGSFAYGDASSDAVVGALLNQFVVRASGGFRFRTSPNESTGCDLQSLSGTFNCTSSRLAKEAFEDLDGGVVLEKLAAMPIQRWRYRGTDEWHVGPTAEDFHAAFDLGEGPTTISTVDADGISLLAVQALERRTAELRRENAELRAKLEVLQALVHQLLPDSTQR